MSLRKFLKTLIVAISTPIFLLIFFVFGIIFILPIFLYRGFVAWMAKVFKRNSLRKILPPSSALFAAEDRYGINAFTSMASMELETPCPDINYIKNCVEKNALQALDTDGITLLYPELKETVKSWMGFLFWAPVSNFNVNDHVNFIQDISGFPIPDWTDTFAFQKLAISLIREKTWIEGRPFWEFIIIPNIPAAQMSSDFRKNCPQGEGSVLMFRMHHLLGDGFCVFKFLTRTLGFHNAAEKVAKPKFLTDARNTTTCFHKILSDAFLKIKIPFDFVNGLLTTWFGEKGGIIPKLNDKSGKGDQLIGLVSDDIPISVIKEIKNKYQVDFTSVLFAMIAAGTRQMIIKANGTPNLLPKVIDLSFPMPMPGHGQRFRNHVSHGMMQLPIAEPDSVKRLKAIHKKVVKMRQSTMPIFVFFIIRLMGILPIYFLKYLRIYAKDLGPPILLTNLLGPAESVSINRVPVLGLRIGSNASIDLPNGYCFLLISYSGNLRVTTGALSNYLRNIEEDAQDLLQYTTNELKTLLGESCV